MATIIKFKPDVPQVDNEVCLGFELVTRGDVAILKVTQGDKASTFSIPVSSSISIILAFLDMYYPGHVRTVVEDMFQLR